MHAEGKVSAALLNPLTKIHQNPPTSQAVAGVSRDSLADFREQLAKNHAFLPYPGLSLMAEPSLATSPAVRAQKFVWEVSHGAQACCLRSAACLNKLRTPLGCGDKGLLEVLLACM